MVLEIFKKVLKRYKDSFFQLVFAVVLFEIIVSIPWILSFQLMGKILLIFTGKSFSIETLMLLKKTINYFIFFTFLAAFLYISFEVGIIKVYETVLRGKPKWEELFYTTKKKWAEAIVANFIVTAIILLFSILVIPICFLLGGKIGSIISTLFILFFSLFFVFINQSIAVGNNSALDAVKESVEIVTKNILDVILMILLVSTIFSSGLVIFPIPIVGEYLFMLYYIIFITPVTGLIITEFYIEKTKLPKKIKSKRTKIKRKLRVKR